MKEMTRLLGKNLSLPDQGPTLLINSSSLVVKNILRLHENSRREDADLLIAQIYDLAMLTCHAFDQERMSRFLDRSNQILAKVDLQDEPAN